MPVTLICQNPSCGIGYQVKLNRIDKSRYCSRKCRGESERGENSYNWRPKVKLVCENCGKEYSTYPSRSKSRFCSRECAFAGRKGQFTLDKHPRWTGARIEANCLACGKKIKTRPTESRKYCSRQCSGVGYHLHCSGPNSHKWQGGKTRESALIRHSLEYRRWRNAVFERDFWTCQGCGIKGLPIHAHHVFPFSDFPEHHFEVWNGLTLCYLCHAKEHPEVLPLQSLEVSS